MRMTDTGEYKVDYNGGDNSLVTLLLAFASVGPLTTIIMLIIPVEGYTQPALITAIVTLIMSFIAGAVYVWTILKEKRRVAKANNLMEHLNHHSEKCKRILVPNRVHSGAKDFLESYTDLLKDCRQKGLSNNKIFRNAIWRLCDSLSTIEVPNLTTKDLDTLCDCITQIYINTDSENNRVIKIEMALVLGKCFKRIGENYADEAPKPPSNRRVTYGGSGIGGGG